MTDEAAAPEVVTTPPATDVTPTEPAQPKERDKVQERIGELTRKNARLEQQLNEFLKEKQKPEPKPELIVPKLEDAGYDEDKHQQALNKYWESVAERKAEEAAERLLQKRDTEAKQKARDTTFTERLNKLSSEDRDLAFSAPVNSDEAATVIKESEIGPEILLYLANNREQAEQIAQLPAFMQAREIGRIEARLEAQKTQAEQKPRVSEAPPPPPKIDASDATTKVSTTDPASDKLSDDDWIKAERKRIANKLKRRNV